jgi:hypothetical protein
LSLDSSLTTFSSGNRPYICEVPGCEKQFARRVTWQKHHRRQHPSEPFPLKANVTRSSGPPGRLSTYAIPGPAGPDGRPSYFYSSSPGSDLPHGFAASHPSEGAAYVFGGGHGHGFTPVFNSRQFAHGTQQQQHLSPNTGNRGDQRQPPRLTVNTPVSAASPFSGGQPSPISPFVNRDEGSDSAIGPENTPTRVQTFQQTHESLPRVTSGPAVMMGYRHEPAVPGPRAVSDSMPARSQPYVSNPTWAPGHVGGGFVQSQLAIPQGHHFQPTLLQTSALTPINTTHSACSDQFSPQSSQAEHFERESSPELVDVRSAAPTFSFYPPSGPPMQHPHSAITGFNPLHHGPPQFVMTQPYPNGGRLHSAPPTLHRFNSMPELPHIAPSWSEIPPYQGPGGYGQSHSIGGGRSHEDEEWEEIQDQMLSREATDDGSGESPEEPTQVTPIEPVKGGGMSHWGAPISFPIPPHRIITQPYPSSNSSVSSSTTLVGQPNMIFPPPQSFPQFQQYPLGGYQLQHAPQPQFFHTPITPSDAHWSHVDGMKHQQPMLESPAVIHNPQQALRHFIQTNPIAQPPQMTQRPGMHISPVDSVHDITLATPPLKSDKSASQGVTAVGLGIANVHFDDSVRRGGMEKGEGDSDDEDYEDKGGGEEDDSDDEFVLGGKKKASKLKKGKKGVRGRGGRTLSVRVGRK